MEYKTFDFELKGTDESGIIEGYASVFRDTPDSYGDIIKPGAFTKTLLERAGKIKVLFGHDSTQIIGKPIEMREDAYGLFTRSQLFLDPDIPEGRKAYALAKLNALNELSIGFSPVKWAVREEAETYGRDLLECRLYEYSMVAFAADDKAVVTAVKQMPDDALIDYWLRVTHELKAGRVISAANAAKLRAAMQQLHELMAAAGMLDAEDDAKAAPDLTIPVPDTAKGAEEPERDRLAATLSLRARALDIEIALARLRAA